MSLARWMLEHGEPEAREFLEQLTVAEILAPPGVHILGDFIFGPDDAPTGIFIFESAGLLSGIEVYGLAGDAPRELPREDALRALGAGDSEA
jgi:hypothetical protein